MNQNDLFYKIGYLDAKVEMLEKILSDKNKIQNTNEFTRSKSFTHSNTFNSKAIKEKMREYEHGFKEWLAKCEQHNAEHRNIIESDAPVSNTKPESDTTKNDINEMKEPPATPNHSE